MLARSVREARVVDRVGEDEVGALVAIGDEDQDEDDHRHADHVNDHRDVVEQRDQVGRVDVDQRVQDHDHAEEDEDLVEFHGTLEVDDQVEVPEAEQVGREGGAGVVDRGHDGDQAHDVEPAGEPGPARPAELGRPPVRAAGGGIGRAQLRHRDGDREDERADDRPAPGDGDRTAVVEGLAVGGEAAGQHRDDREGDREVGELAPDAAEVLVQTFDRAQQQTQEALAAFRLFRSRYPQDPLLAEAEGHIQFLRQRLAEHEFAVARFYYKKKAYHAAIGRLLNLIQVYPETPDIDTALYMLADSYREEENYRKAQGMLQLLIERFPTSKYVTQARNQLRTLPQTGITLQ